MLTTLAAREMEPMAKLRKVSALKHFKITTMSRSNHTQIIDPPYPVLARTFRFLFLLLLLRRSVVYDVPENKVFGQISSKL